MKDDIPVEQRNVDITESTEKIHIDVADDEFEMKDYPATTRKRSMTFSPWKPDTITTVLSWKDVTVRTKTKPAKVLLENVSGEILGGFYAIMGSSGGGKTTLLSTLSLRLDNSKIEIEGTLHLNGREYDKKNLKQMSAYVLQDDLLHAELTVLETISYAAKLRLAGKVQSDEERDDIVDEVIALMGISHVKDVIIGDTRKKGISGGERKRVCVAIELLTHPKLLFLDEPTSGLDSTTALKVISALKNLASHGVCTVICTIHQPQRKIFDMFDNLILMKKGRIIYQGSCSKSITFLANIGLTCPEEMNPADFLIEAISSTGDTTADALDANAKKEVPIDLTLGSNLLFESKEFSFNGWWIEFCTLFRRSGMQYLRRTDIIFMNLIVTIVISVFVSCGIWNHIGNDQASIATRVPSLFFASVTQGIVASLQCISSFPAERAIILRERAAGAYHVSAYFLAKSLVDILSVSWGPSVFCAIVYPTIGYQNTASHFFTYWIFMVLDSLAALSLATCVSCCCVSVEMSTVVLSVLLEIARLYGGFFTSPLQLKEFPEWRFADALSYLKYVFVGVALNELTGLELTCTAAEVAANTCITSGETIIASKGYDEYTIGFCAGILVLYIVGLRIISFIALRVINK